LQKHLQTLLRYNEIYNNTNFAHENFTIQTLARVNFNWTERSDFFQNAIVSISNDYQVEFTILIIPVNNTNWVRFRN
jgi:hypothetical protein